MSLVIWLPWDGLQMWCYLNLNWNKTYRIAAILRILLGFSINLLSFFMDVLHLFESWKVSWIQLMRNGENEVENM